MYGCVYAFVLGDGWVSLCACICVGGSVGGCVCVHRCVGGWVGVDV